MSKWNSLIEKLKADNGLRERLEEITGAADKPYTEEQMQRLLELAEKSGYKAENLRELSDEDLEGVAGGGGIPRPPKQNIKL